MMPRKVTYGVRLPRVAGQRKRLAATAAIIDRFFAGRSGKAPASNPSPGTH